MAYQGRRRQRILERDEPTALLASSTHEDADDDATTAAHAHTTSVPERPNTRLLPPETEGPSAPEPSMADRVRAKLQRKSDAKPTARSVPMTRQKVKLVVEPSKSGAGKARTRLLINTIGRGVDATSLQRALTATAKRVQSREHSNRNVAKPQHALTQKD
ncbi:hypothetical protein SDRG_00453 [Saprolegnia diclina VS20]|uniref:Uncharacterized protein n=1 Tax=Saprolegnia diclina (strain VS20) TaxID=1156394 RepID=T0R8D3_SAPDV|nr:hypothetical protein SDRG_00453 [Saprolegnia diclina VS20]EQC42730.1 hypothetical protein SDRG_00453 [Saprolegnia diclina VS20]|eukprot:XP_008604153.1 hypothetical protein SDRG_00453 [Saprolegnia diclina VS20]